MNTRPRCYNRPDYHESLEVQDGYEDVNVVAADDAPRLVRVPRMKVIPNAMSKDCKQHGPFGAATCFGWNCHGCRHAPEGLREADDELLARVQASWAKRWEKRS